MYRQTWLHAKYGPQGQVELIFEYLTKGTKTILAQIDAKPKCRGKNCHVGHIYLGCYFPFNSVNY
uniref:Uncharacterized protein n=1 Tax=Rhizophora mucronata TaxID=61149 RepID=A0A2P2Q0D6_RHIMU